MPVRPKKPPVTGSQARATSISTRFAANVSMPKYRYVARRLTSTTTTLKSAHSSGAATRATHPETPLSMAINAAA